jgi:tetratricopeptide (TPR) repeat protein
MGYFQQAIETDPAYALAYSGLADSYGILGFWGFLSPEDSFPKAKALAEKALKIDDTLAEAHAFLSIPGMRWYTSSTASISPRWDDMMKSSKK